MIIKCHFRTTCGSRRSWFRGKCWRSRLVIRLWPSLGINTTTTLVAVWLRATRKSTIFNLCTYGVYWPRPWLLQIPSAGHYKINQYNTIQYTKHFVTFVTGKKHGTLSRHVRTILTVVTITFRSATRLAYFLRNELHSSAAIGWM